MERGKFITFEGIEGVGKSTNIAAFVERIEAGGHKVLTTREPGGISSGGRPSVDHEGSLASHLVQLPRGRPTRDQEDERDRRGGRDQSPAPTAQPGHRQRRLPLPPSGEIARDELLFEPLAETLVGPGVAHLAENLPQPALLGLVAGHSITPFRYLRNFDSARE